MLKVRYGPAAGGYSLRVGPTHDEQPLAHRHYGRGYARSDGGGDDDDDDDDDEMKSAQGHPR